MSKIKPTPEIENMFLKAVELCDKYELEKTKSTLDALTEMYRLGAVYAIQQMNQNSGTISYEVHTGNRL